MAISDKRPVVLALLLYCTGTCTCKSTSSTAQQLSTKIYQHAAQVICSSKFAVFLSPHMTLKIFRCVLQVRSALFPVPITHYTAVPATRDSKNHARPVPVDDAHRHSNYNVICHNQALHFLFGLQWRSQRAVLHHSLCR